MIDPGTAYYIVSGICWPVVKLGGIGASYVGPMLGFTATGIAKGSLAAAAQSSIPYVAGGSVFSAMQSATTTAATTAAGTIGVVPTAALGAVAYGVYRCMR